MKTHELIMLVLALPAGLLLGLFFFGGLWFTVKKMLSSKVPGLLALFSFLIRTAVVLLGFYAIAGNDLKRLLVGTTGFLLARLILKKRMATLPLKKAGYEVKS